MTGRNFLFIQKKLLHAYGQQLSLRTLNHLKAFVISNDHLRFNSLNGLQDNTDDNDQGRYP